MAGKHTAEITAIEVHRQSATVTGNVSMNIDKETLDGQLQLNAPEALVLEREIPEDMRISGPITATATLGGTFDAFRLDSQINGHDLTIAGQPADRITGVAVITADTADFSTLTIDHGEGQVTGTLKYNWDTDALETNLQGQKLTYRTSLLSEGDTLATFSPTNTAGTIEADREDRRALSLSGGAAGESLATAIHSRPARRSYLRVTAGRRADR